MIEPFVEKDIDAHNLEPVAKHMTYLGTLVEASLVGPKGSRATASIPVVVWADEQLLGIIVISEPGLYGSIPARLVEAGYEGSIRTQFAYELSHELKLSAARAVAAQKDSVLDYSTILMSLGYTLNSLT